MKSLFSLDPVLNLQGEQLLFRDEEIDLRRTQFCLHSSSSSASPFHVDVVADNIVAFLDADFAIGVFQFISRVCYAVTNTAEFWIERIQRHRGLASHSSPMTMTSTAPTEDPPDDDADVVSLRRYFFRHVRYHSCSEMRFCPAAHKPSQDANPSVAGSVMFGAPARATSFTMFCFQHTIPFCNSDSSYTFSLRAFFPSEIVPCPKTFAKIDITAEWVETYEVPSPSPDDIDPGYLMNPGRIEHVETMYEGRVDLDDLLRNVPIGEWIEIEIGRGLRVHERGWNKATHFEFKWAQLSRGPIPEIWVDGVVVRAHSK